VVLVVLFRKEKGKKKKRKSKENAERDLTCSLKADYNSLVCE